MGHKYLQTSRTCGSLNMPNFSWDVGMVSRSLKTFKFYSPNAALKRFGDETKVLKTFPETFNNINLKIIFLSKTDRNWNHQIIDKPLWNLRFWPSSKNYLINTDSSENTKFGKPLNIGLPSISQRLHNYLKFLTDPNICRVCTCLYYAHQV